MQSLNLRRREPAHLCRRQKANADREDPQPLNLRLRQRGPGCVGPQRECSRIGNRKNLEGREKGNLGRIQVLEIEVNKRLDLSGR